MILSCCSVGSAPAFFGKGDDKPTAFAVMDEAWRLGICRFDTADAYGGGLSETWIGEWMQARARKPFVITKTYNPMGANEDGGLSPVRINRQIRASLQRLGGVASVDRYLCHEYDNSVSLQDTIAALEELKRGGLLADWGVSNFTLAQLRQAVAICKPREIQNNFSLLERTAETEGLLQYCRQEGIEFNAFSPLCGGWVLLILARNQPFVH